MKTLTKILSATAVALALAAVAAPSQASVFASFTPDTGAANYRWVNSGASNSGTGGAFYTTTTNTGTSVGANAVHFNFVGDHTDPALAYLPAAFTLNGTVGAGNAAVFTPGPNTYTQAHLDGNFSFIYTGASQFYGSQFLSNGANLLTGHFTNAWIQGNGGTGSTNLSIGNGGTLTYDSSDLAPEVFWGLIPGTEEFSLNLLGVTPNFGANTGKALKSFRANGGGNFSFGVPEPGTWALMILGFGGVGVMLRRRRQGVAFA